MSIKFNYSTCDSAEKTLYGGSMATPSRGLDYGTLDVKTPRLRGQFDNTSASISIDGFYAVNPPKIRSQNRFVGPISISFLGNIDRDRSDEMALSTNNTPVWKQTLGFEQEESTAVRLGTISMSVSYALVIGFVYLTLLWAW